MTTQRSKKGVFLASIFTLALILILSAFLATPTSSTSFIPESGAGLWDGVEYKVLPGGRSPSIIGLPGGEMLAVSSDGKLFRILRTGVVQTIGQVSGVSIVTPASYFELGGKKYIVYASDNGTNSKLVVQDISDGTYKESSLENSSWSGVTVYVNGGKAVIFTSSIGERKGKVYRFEFDGTTLSQKSSQLIDGSAKVPLLLSPDKKELYVLTQNGKFYVIDESNLNVIKGPIELSGEFITPMAMDSQKNVYAINSTGVMYVIERSQITDSSYVPKSAKVLPSANVAGILVDSYGIIYAFGAGSVVAVRQTGGSISVYGGPFVVGGIINSTPLAVLGRDYKTYLVIPSTVGADGVLTVVSFDPENKTFSKVWEKTLRGGAFTITSALTSSQTAEETAMYYFATSISTGYVYAWKMNGKPVGDWPMYGQNRERSNYLSFVAEEETRITIMAKEPLNGKFFKLPALKFKGKIFDTVSATYSPETDYLTNPGKDDPVPKSYPARYQLSLYFEPYGSRQLFVPGSKFVNDVLGGTPSLPETDTTLSFAQWDVDSIYKYPGKKDDGRDASNPANITFAYYDKRYDVIANVKYLWRILHQLPGSSSEQEDKIVSLTYENVEKGKDFVEIVKPKSGYKPFDWTVYMWDPDDPKGYVVYDKDYLKANGMITEALELKLKKSGPAYIRIKYTTSSGSIRLIMPKYAYGRTYIYILVDAAKGANTIWFTLTTDTAKGIKFEKIVSEQIANIGTMQVLERTVDSGKIKYVFGGPLFELTEDTRIATITALAFFERPIYFGTDVNKSDFIRFEEGFIQIKGVTASPSETEDLAPYREIIPNSKVFLLGDFDNNGWVNLDDWNRLVEKYGTTVSGVDVIYNIGPRDKNFSVDPYDPGALLDTANKIDQWDVAVFAQMYGMKTTPEDILKDYPFKK
ncbi:hypothetical protein [Fervidobacterium thailandense]|uniref:Uncharacterized protein n=1 Tax=Fervidobacterium thailandense TaxID=1008305 RepID=A0A1E3G4S0_9BACT|nr:hypothetical protein [Fervidobacterium thailandense]ODN30648.1 hypothetical protein A4H02_03660 [Fervidobacterium thailandense]